MKRILPFLFALPLAGVSETPVAPAEKEQKVEVHEGMIQLPGGTFSMGHSGTVPTANGPLRYPEEEPAHDVQVKGFWIDKTEVTNGAFAAFVKATGYVTFAEKIGDPMPGQPADAKVPNGAIIFIENPNIKGSASEPGRALDWWKWEPTANWRHPAGGTSSIEGKDNYPVVCVNYDDAAAYAKWAHKRLPTEAEWEYAARGTFKQTLYAWGDELKPDGKWMANIWQGDFPNHNTAEDGYAGAAPVGSFPPNSVGLSDMAGNVWEICADYYDPAYFHNSPSDNPKGPDTWVNQDVGGHGKGPACHVIKGGSFLCHASYCMRYRPAARQSQAADSPTNHAGFRCVAD